MTLAKTGLLCTGIYKKTEALWLYGPQFQVRVDGRRLSIVAGLFGEIFAIEDSGLPAKSEGSEVSITFKDGGSCLVPL